MAALALALAILALGVATIALLHTIGSAEQRRREYRQLTATIERQQRQRDLDQHLIPTNGKTTHHP